MAPFAAAALILILARCAAELFLSRINQRHVVAHAGSVPETFRGVIDEPTYAKSVAYTVAKAGFGNIQQVYETAILIALLFSGVLPSIFSRWTEHAGGSAWAA